MSLLLLRMPACRWVCLLLLAVIALSLVGCASTEEEGGYSDRPWNTPRGWETGLPSEIYERR